MQGQLEPFVQPSSGRAGASFDKKRFLRKSSASVQLSGFASMLIACHFAGTPVCFARTWFAAATGEVAPRFTLERSGIEGEGERRNIVFLRIPEC